MNQVKAPKAQSASLKQYLPHGCVLLAGCLWGVVGLFTRNLTASGFSAQDIVLLRNLGGLVLLTLLFVCIDRSAFRVKLRHLPYFFGTGIASVLLFTLCYFSCQQVCSLAVAAILLYTAPTFVVVLSALLWKDKITKQKMTALIAAFLGCSFVTGIWSGSLSLTLQGFLLGLGSGFFYGLYSIFGRYALGHYKPFTVTYYTFLFAGVGAIFVTDPRKVASALSGSATLVLLSLGLVLISTVLPYLFYTRGLAELDSGKASILASTEPMLAALAGMIAFGEALGLSVLLGFICILISIYMLR